MLDDRAVPVATEQVLPLRDRGRVIWFCSSIPMTLNVAPNVSFGWRPVSRPKVSPFRAYGSIAAISAIMRGAYAKSWMRVDCRR